jgi:dihydrofolate reductase
VPVVWKIILMMQLSLDGDIEGPDGDLSWHMVDHELHSHFNDLLRTMGAATFCSSRRMPAPSFDLPKPAPPETLWSCCAAWRERAY